MTVLASSASACESAAFIVASSPCALVTSAIACASLKTVFKLAQAIAEVTKAQGELATMKAALSQAEAELAKTVIHAPNPGFVVLEEVAAPGDTKHKLRVGDTVWQGQPILYLPDSSAMLV